MYIFGISLLNGMPTYSTIWQYGMPRYALCHGRVVCGNLEQGVFEMYVQGSGEGGQAGSADLWGLEGRGEPWQRLEY